MIIFKQTINAKLIKKSLILFKQNTTTFVYQKALITVLTHGFVEF